MKKLLSLLIITIIVVNSFAGVKKIKADLKSCETALKHCLSSKQIVPDTIFIYSSKTTVQVAKAKELTKRKQIQSDLKKKNQEIRQTRTKERHKTKRNFIFQFFNTMKMFFGSLTIGEIFGSGAGVAGFIGVFGGMFEKYKPITALFKIFTKK